MPTFAETFTNVAWANGDTITEVKLDEMVANDRYAREVRDFRLLAGGTHIEPFSISVPTGDPAPSSATLNFRAVIDGGTSFISVANFSASTLGTSYQNSDKDEDISGVSDGLHYASLGGYAASGLPDRRVYFVKTPEINYGSCWVSSYIAENAPMEPAGPSGMFDVYSYLAIHTYTIVGHRVAEGW